MKRASVLTADLSDMSIQKWIPNTYARHYVDQYGNKIHYGVRGRYRLEMTGYPEIVTHSKHAAMLVSAVIMNDRVMNKK